MVLSYMMFPMCPSFPSGPVPSAEASQGTLIRSAWPCSLSSPHLPSCPHLPDLFWKVFAKQRQKQPNAGLPRAPTPSLTGPWHWSQWASIDMRVCAPCAFSVVWVWANWLAVGCEEHQLWAFECCYCSAIVAVMWKLLTSLSASTFPPSRCFVMAQELT